MFLGLFIVCVLVVLLAICEHKIKGPLKRTIIVWACCLIIAVLFGSISLDVGRGMGRNALSRLVMDVFEILEQRIAGMPPDDARRYTKETGTQMSIVMPSDAKMTHFVNELRSGDRPPTHSGDNSTHNLQR